MSIHENSNLAKVTNDKIAKMEDELADYEARIARAKKRTLDAEANAEVAENKASHIQSKFNNESTINQLSEQLKNGDSRFSQLSEQLKTSHNEQIEMTDLARQQQLKMAELTRQEQLNLAELTRQEQLKMAELANQESLKRAQDEQAKIVEIEKKLNEKLNNHNTGGDSMNQDQVTIYEQKMELMKQKMDFEYQKKMQELYSKMQQIENHKLDLVNKEKVLRERETQAPQQAPQYQPQQATQYQPQQQQQPQDFFNLNSKNDNSFDLIKDLEEVKKQNAELKSIVGKFFNENKRKTLQQEVRDTVTIQQSMYPTVFKSLNKHNTLNSIIDLALKGKEETGDNYNVEHAIKAYEDILTSIGKTYMNANGLENELNKTLKYDSEYNQEIVNPTEDDIINSKENVVTHTGTHVDDNKVNQTTVEKDSSTVTPEAPASKDVYTANNSSKSNVMRQALINAKVI